jgi:hypothetical protein
MEKWIRLFGLSRKSEEMILVGVAPGKNISTAMDV